LPRGFEHRRESAEEVQNRLSGTASQGVHKLLLVLWPELLKTEVAEFREDVTVEVGFTGLRGRRFEVLEYLLAPALQIPTQ
jgi:hypothetical protein